MAEITDQLIEFTKMHDEFIVEWNQAMKTGDTSAVERMDDEYFAVFIKEKPAVFNKEEALAGMKQSVQELIGAKKHFQNRVIRLRDDENAVVFYELLIKKEMQVLARLFTIENWQLKNGCWVLIKEIEEPI